MSDEIDFGSLRRRLDELQKAEQEAGRLERRIAKGSRRTGKHAPHLRGLERSLHGDGLPRRERRQRNRRKLIPSDWRCPRCNETVVVSRSWVIKENFIGCLSCYRAHVKGTDT